jgi:hypothetical protein
LIFGIGLPQARIVAATFMVLAELSFYLAVRRLVGQTGALIALAP